MVLALISLAVSGCANGPSGGEAASWGGGGSLFGKKGEPWTIRCIELRGPHAAQQVEHLAQALKQTSNIRRADVWLTHDLDGYSRLYYGTYHRVREHKTGKRSVPPAMRRDLLLIKELADESGQRYFIQAMVVPKPLPDVGNPAWELGSADGVFSLQVAAFAPAGKFTQYKQAAAEYCAQLREQGYEAYFHHGASCSIVTVGSFGDDALIIKKVPIIEKKGRHGKPKLCGTAVETHYSEEVLALQRNKLFKYNYVNGKLLRERRGNKLGRPPPSQLVRIPKRGADEPW